MDQNLTRSLRSSIIGIALLGGLVCPLQASGQGEAEMQGEASPNPVAIFDRPRITGDWWGVRGRLGAKGLTVGGENISEFSSVFDGGVNQKGSFRNLFTVDAEAEMEALIGLQGGTAFIQYLSVNAEDGGSLDAGDLQGYSNIENADSLDVIYELWYEQLIFGDRVRIKAGKVDANSDFAFVDAAGDFANSSVGFSPSIFAFPSYPDSAMSINVFTTVYEGERARATIGYGLYDGAAAAYGVRTGSRGPSTFFDDDISDDYFHIGQFDMSWDSLMPERALLGAGRVSAGVWHHTGAFARFEGGTERGVTGLFATGEFRVFDPDREPGSAVQADAPERGVYVFGQYGWADDEVSEVGHHLAVGVVWRGLTPERPGDSAGLYLSLADLSDEAAAGFEDDEFVLDTYYRAQLAPAIYVQPELQYILNPSGDPSIDDALVGGIRVGVVF